jgi:hypothetical protein
LLLFDDPYFLLELPSFIHPKILNRFYSIYFKVPHKISAQSDGRIENYIQKHKTSQIVIFRQISEFLQKFLNFNPSYNIILEGSCKFLEFSDNPIKSYELFLCYMKLVNL